MRLLRLGRALALVGALLPAILLASDLTSTQTSIADVDRVSADARAAQSAEDLRATAQRLQEALRAVVSAGDMPGEALASRRLGNVLRLLGDRSSAMPYLLRARDLYAAAGDREHLLDVYELLVYTLPPGDGDGPGGDALRTTALATAREAPPRNTECAILHEWGDSLFDRGQLGVAFTRLHEALDCFETTTERGREGRVLVSIGRVYRAHGRLQEALAQHTRALALQQQVNDVAGAAQSLNAIAVTLSMMGRQSEALERYQQALTLATENRLASYETTLRGNIGGHYLAQGRYREAVDIFELALQQERNATYKAVRTRQLAAAYAGLGNMTRARVLADQSVRMATSVELKASAHDSRARMRIRQADFAGASGPPGRARPGRRCATAGDPDRFHEARVQPGASAAVLDGHRSAHETRTTHRGARDGRTSARAGLSRLVGDETLDAYADAHRLPCTGNLVPRSCASFDR